MSCGTDSRHDPSDAATRGTEMMSALGHSENLSKLTGVKVLLRHCSKLL
jgi:hypothetical protein